MLTSSCVARGRDGNSDADDDEDAGEDEGNARECDIAAFAAADELAAVALDALPLVADRTVDDDDDDDDDEEEAEEEDDGDEANGGRQHSHGPQ